MGGKRAGMDIPSRPKQSQARKNLDERVKIARLFHKRAYSQFVGFVDLLPRHCSGIHHHRNMFVDWVLLEVAQHRQPIHHRHAMIEDDDVRLALGPITKFPLPFEAIEHFLSISGHDLIAFQLGGIEGAFYKEDVIGVIFPEEYPAAMWHIVKV